MFDSTKIKEKALQLGYSACGIIPAIVFEEYQQSLAQRIKSFPWSKDFYEKQFNRITPPKDAKSIIVCVRGYNHYKIPDSLKPHIGKYYLFHGEIPYSSEFRAKAEFDTFLQVSGVRIVKCQTPPVRWAAVKAGLGKFGRNNFFYTHEHGSYVHIDAWVVDTAFDYDNPSNPTLMPECRENCRKCIDACPTNAMDGDFSMDRDKCITYLIYGKKPQTQETREQMGLWLYGCDACQDVCPMNKGKLTEKETFPLLSHFEEHMQLDKIAAMDKDTYENVIFPRFWFVGKDALSIWQNNALRAMNNSKDHCVR